MQMRSDDPHGEGTPASWGSPIEAHAVFDGFGDNVRLYLRGIFNARTAVARGLINGTVFYKELTEEEEGRATEPVLTLSENEARAVYKALHRQFGEPEARYADAEFMRSVYDREATRLDRLLFGDA